MVECHLSTLSPARAEPKREVSIDGFKHIEVYGAEAP